MYSCSTPKALKYEGYSDFQIEKLGFTNSQVSFNLQLYNPNNFSLRMKNADMNVFVNDKLLGHTFSDSAMRISKRSRITIPVNVDIDMRNAFKNALSTLTGRELEIRVEGKVKAGKSYLFLNIPVQYKTQRKFQLF